jgi:hypothetical protein
MTAGSGVGYRGAKVKGEVKSGIKDDSKKRKV